MNKIENYDIIFSGLKNGIHEFKFEIDKAFFILFKTDQEFENPNIRVIAELDKKATFMELKLDITGNVELTCDISNEKFDYEIDDQSKYVVKYGEELDESHEEIIVIPREDHFLNIAQIIYETIALSIPMKKRSPHLSEDDLLLLDKYSPQEQNKSEESEESDPRWDALKKLKK